MCTSITIEKMICNSKLVRFCGNFKQFYGRDSAEASAEASVDLAEASVSAESLFTPIRSFTIYSSQINAKPEWNLSKLKFFDELFLRKFKNLAKKLSDFDKNLTTKKTICVDLDE